MASSVVDAKRKAVTLSFRVDTRGMRKGETRHMHQGGVNVTDAAMVTHPDILNPQSVDVSTMSNAGVVGVTVFHTLNGEPNAEGKIEPHRLDTDDHVYHADAGRVGQPVPDALKLHALGFGSTVSTTKLMVNPSKEQLPDQKQIIQKKIDPKWRGFTEESVTAGAYKAELEGHDSSHYLIRETDHRTGTKSAIWNLLDVRSPPLRIPSVVIPFPANPL